jgi:N-dimethylarginine dimethylaminohydrolase
MLHEDDDFAGTVGVDPAGVAAPARIQGPRDIRRPAFLLNPPFSYSTDVANNVWMQELSDEERQPNQTRAMSQFLEVYDFLAADGLVYLLPTPRGCDLQDLVFTANLGVVLEHLETPTVVISNFTSEPRRGETPVGEQFFASMGFDVHVSPHKFEGEAELKHLRDDVYVGGHGQRSEADSYKWMQDTFGMTVVPLRMTDPYLYHLDCSVFPLTREDTMVCTELYETEEIIALEKHTNIIDVSVSDAYAGICNSVRLSNIILNSSHIHELRAGTEDHRNELHKNRSLEDIAVDRALEVSYFNLSEYHKGGALLSCMVMHLNRFSYAFKLV